MSSGGLFLFAPLIGLLEEGLVTQSLFNPNYVHLRLLDPGYVPWLGIGLPWTLFVLTLHVVWSIATPIVMAEALVPARRHRPWLSRIGLAVVAVLFVVGVVGNAAFSVGNDLFRHGAHRPGLVGPTRLGADARARARDRRDGGVRLALVRRGGRGAGG